MRVGSIFTRNAFEPRHPKTKQRSINTVGGLLARAPQLVLGLSDIVIGRVVSEEGGHSRLSWRTKLAKNSTMPEQNFVHQVVYNTTTLLHFGQVARIHSKLTEHPSCDLDIRSQNPGIWVVQGLDQQPLPHHKRPKLGSSALYNGLWRTKGPRFC